MTIKAANNSANITFDAKTGKADCKGKWTVAVIATLIEHLHKIKWPHSGEITINGSNIEAMDSSGAWELQKLIKFLEKRGLKVKLENFSEQQNKLLELIQKQTAHFKKVPEGKTWPWIARLGKKSVDGYKEMMRFLNFTGEITWITLKSIKKKGLPMPLRSFFYIIETTGYQALPIIAVLSFMIGVVITYQMGLQLRNYGANVYIVDLLGLAVLREFGPMITAVMVAGRTGSAFTAQLGTMKLNEEIDALKTMGISPVNLLILPRLVGLLVALPLLTIWSDIFGVIGGMIMAKNMMQISWYDFLTRFQQVIPVRPFLIGIGKAPVFALIIASVGCFQGFQVSGGADSVGRQTTKSVVQAIFFILVADAIFSVIFSKFDL